MTSVSVLQTPTFNLLASQILAGGLTKLVACAETRGRLLRVFHWKTNFAQPDELMLKKNDKPGCGKLVRPMQAHERRPTPHEAAKLLRASNSRCPECGVEMSFFGGLTCYSFDRINDCVLHILGNLRVCCWRCNRRRAKDSVCELECGAGCGHRGPLADFSR